jgi:hypothetical protein
MAAGTYLAKYSGLKSAGHSLSPFLNVLLHSLPHSKINRQQTLSVKTTTWGL